MTRADRIAAFLVAAVTFVVFIPALGAGFVTDWDDGIAIVQNPHLHSFDWRWMFGDLAYNPRYMPLTWLDWTATYRLFGLRPLPYHLGNVLLHAANAALLYVVLVRLLPSLRARVTPLRAAAATALGVLAWSLHPLRVEPVTWATDRSYSQSLFFLLVAVALHLSWITARARWRYVAAVVAYAAAVLSYPIVVGAAAALFFVDVALARPLTRATIVEKLPYLGLSAAALAMTVLSRFTPTEVWTPPTTLHAFGPFARVMQAMYVWTYYAWRPFVPVGLSPVYTQLIDFDPWSPPFVASALFVVALTVAAWTLKRRAPWLLAAWGAHLVLLVPSLGLTERPHFPNDRYDHLAGLVLAALVAALLLRVRAAATVAAAAVVASLAALTVKQEAVWHDELTLYEHVLDELGDDPYRAEIYRRLAELFTRHGDAVHALRAWDARIALQPDSAVGRWERARLRFGVGDFAGAVDDAGVVLAHRDDPVPRELRGLALARLGRLDDALADLRVAAHLRPHDRTLQRSYTLVFALRVAFGTSP